MEPERTACREPIEEGSWKKDRYFSNRWEIQVQVQSNHLTDRLAECFCKMPFLLKNSSILQNQSSLDHLSLENLSSLEDRFFGGSEKKGFIIEIASSKYLKLRHVRNICTSIQLYNKPPTLHNLS